MEKSKKDYEREEERNKDRQVLKVLIPSFIAILFVIFLCIWLFGEVEKEISKTYEGIFVNAAGTEEKKVTIEIEGTAIYESMFADNFYRGDVGILVKDESGNIIMDMASGIPTLPEEFDMLNHSGLIEFKRAENKVEFVGIFCFDDQLEKILLKMDNGTYIAAPATNVEEAEAIYDMHK